MSWQAAVFLKYANLQMAAEAYLSNWGNQISVAALEDGNRRSSRFPEALALQLIADGWTVVAHRSNQSSGFSGTLFKYIGESDPARGLVKGELVLSFRSTEFADDAARDNEATNTLEVRPFGFAFGQIADMEKWYAELKTTSGALPAGARFVVTGYTVRGHSVAGSHVMLDKVTMPGLSV